MRLVTYHFSTLLDRKPPIDALNHFPTRTRIWPQETPAPTKQGYRYRRYELKEEANAKLKRRKEAAFTAHRSSTSHTPTTHHRRHRLGCRISVQWRLDGSCNPQAEQQRQAGAPRRSCSRKSKVPVWMHLLTDTTCRCRWYNGLTISSAVFPRPTICEQ